MPSLRNARYETVAQALALGKTNKAAYAEAGFTGKSLGAPNKVCNHPDVVVRVAEIIRERHEVERRSQLKAIEDAAIDKGYIVSRTKYVIDRSIRGTKPVYTEGVITSWLPSHGDNTAAINGLKLLAHMGGYLVEQIEIGRAGDFARLTDDELADQLMIVGEAIGIPADQVQKAIAGK